MKLPLQFALSEYALEKGKCVCKNFELSLLSDMFVVYTIDVSIKSVFGVYLDL